MFQTKHITALLILGLVVVGCKKQSTTPTENSLQGQDATSTTLRNPCGEGRLVLNAWEYSVSPSLNTDISLSESMSLCGNYRETLRGSSKYYDKSACVDSPDKELNMFAVLLCVSPSLRCGGNQQPSLQTIVTKDSAVEAPNWSSSASDWPKYTFRSLQETQTSVADISTNKYKIKPGSLMKFIPKDVQAECRAFAEQQVASHTYPLKKKCQDGVFQSQPYTSQWDISFSYPPFPIGKPDRAYDKETDALLFTCKTHAEVLCCTNEKLTK